MRFVLYLILLGAIFYLLWAWGRRQVMSLPKPEGEAKPRNRFKPRKSSQEIWVQVFETDSFDEARKIQARLQEDDLECILYEQGKKDIHGNPLKGVGIAVPKTAVSHAQRIISRMLV
jgi:hypothetical protein